MERSRNDVSLHELRGITIIFRAKGLTQSDAYHILIEVQKMLTNEDETKEDLILEPMDFVVGYCQI
ncbi:MAG: hypothetical protein LBI27_07215 [Clostridiales bacterium]|nr:hypothetical protein [Clostridiales bacterium]